LSIDKIIDEFSKKNIDLKKVLEMLKLSNNRNMKEFEIKGGLKIIVDLLKKKIKLFKILFNNVDSIIVSSEEVIDINKFGLFLFLLKKKKKN
jgi:hypothetical protein